MALSGKLVEAGFKPKVIRATATVYLNKHEAGFASLECIG